MSLYAQYLFERTDDQIIENDKGFITWRYLDENTVYIIDIFVLHSYRMSGVGLELTSQVVNEAKRKGCKELIGTVCVKAKGSDESLKALQAYGMKLKSASNDVIVLHKEI